MGVPQECAWNNFFILRAQAAWQRKSDELPAPPTQNTLSTLFNAYS